MVQHFPAGHPGPERRLIANTLGGLVCCIPGKEKQVPLFPNKDCAPSRHLFGISLISEQRWPSNAKHTALCTATRCHYHSEGVRAHIVWDGLAMAVGRPWPASPPVDPARQSGETWGKYWARGSLRFSGSAAPGLLSMLERTQLPTAQNDGREVT